MQKLAIFFACFVIFFPLFYACGAIIGFDPKNHQDEDTYLQIIDSLIHIGTLGYLVKKSAY